MHHRGDAVRGEDHQGTLGNLVQLVDEDRPALLECLDDVPVVHDLLAYVDGRAVQVERLLDGHDRPVDTGAVPTRRGEQDPTLGCTHAPMVGTLPRGGGSPVR